MRERAANPPPALAVLLPGVRAGHDISRRAGRGGTIEKNSRARIEGFAVQFDESGFVIEQVALAGAAIHEQLYHPPGLGTVMQAAVEVPGWRRRG